ncbi:hypothetical protein L325_05650 [Yersinia pestis 9]|nr:hypothetical protein L325_05650 [Yersinia pestis 9]
MHHGFQDYGGNLIGVLGYQRDKISDILRIPRVIKAALWRIGKQILG